MSSSSQVYTPSSFWHRVLYRWRNRGVTTYIVTRLLAVALAAAGTYLSMHGWGAGKALLALCGVLFIYEVARAITLYEEYEDRRAQGPQFDEPVQDVLLDMLTVWLETRLRLLTMVLMLVVSYAVSYLP